MLANIKKVFWKLGITDDICPFCGKELESHG